MAQVLLVKTHWSQMYSPYNHQSNLSTLWKNIRFWRAISKLISDYAQDEISNKAKDILRMYHSCSWHSEPYHQNKNPSEWCYRTIKPSTNTTLNRTGAPVNCWLLCMSYVTCFYQCLGYVLAVLNLSIPKIIIPW